MPITHIGVGNLLLDSIKTLSLVTRNSCLIARIDMLLDHFHGLSKLVPQFFMKLDVEVRIYKKQMKFLQYV